MSVPRELTEETKPLDNSTKIPLPNLPEKIDAKDLHGNGKLLPDDQIDEAKKLLAREGDGVLARNYLKGAKFDRRLMKAGGHIFAIYKGLKHATLGNPLGKAVGKGSFGKAILAQDLETGRYFILKVQTSKNEDEHTILTALNLSVGGILEKKRGEAAPESKAKDKYYSLMELAPGMELAVYLKEASEGHRSISDERLLDIIQQMIACVAELHQKGFLHRDIKLENFMYDEVTNKVTLIDYGLTAEAEKGEARSKAVGSPRYIAPEIKSAMPSEGEVVFNEKTEVYALGKAIQGVLGMEIRTQWFGIDDRFHYNSPTPFSEMKEVQRFVESTLAEDPANRPSLKTSKEFFSSLREQQKPLLDVTIGVLDLEAYKKADPEMKAQFIMALKRVNNVLVVDSSPTADSAERIELVKELKKQGLTLCDTLLIDPEGMSTEAINDYVDEYQKRNNVQVKNTIIFDNSRNVNDDSRSFLNSNGIDLIGVERGRDAQHYRNERDKYVKLSARIYQTTMDDFTASLSKLSEDKKPRSLLNEQKRKAFYELVTETSTSLKNLRDTGKLTIQVYNNLMSNYYRKADKINKMKMATPSQTSIFRPETPPTSSPTPSPTPSPSPEDVKFKKNS